MSARISLRVMWLGLLRLIIVAAALSACDTPKKRPAAAPPDTAENQALMRKLQGYLECHADHSEHVFRIADNYRKQFEHTPPTATSAVALTALKHPLDCLAAIQDAKQLPPAMPALETAGNAYARALFEIYRLTSSYDANQAAALHPRLLEAFTEFDTAQAALFDQLYELNRGVHLAQHARRLQKEGRTLEVVAEAALLAGELVARYASAPSHGLDRLDTQKLAASVAELEVMLEEIAVHDAFVAPEGKEPDLVKAFEGYTTLLERGRTLATAARQLVQRAHNRVAYSASEQLMIDAGNEAEVVGTPASVAHAYNRFVEAR